MQINDKVYFVSRGTVAPGIIVAKKRVFNPWPTSEYIVKKIKGADGIANVITAAFYGVADELVYTGGEQLIPMPAVDYEQEPKA